MDAREVYIQSRKAGYSPDQAEARAREFEKTGQVPPDPTEKYWPALIQQESRGDQSAVSPKGAVGIAQVMPTTGPEAAAMAGLDWDENLFKGSADYNAAIGRAYLRNRMEMFPGEDWRALGAYNAGQSRAKAARSLDDMPAETRQYVQKIMGNVQGKAKMTPRERYIELRRQGIEADAAEDQVRQEFRLEPRVPRGTPPQAQAAAPAPQPQPPAPAPTPAPQAAAPVPPPTGQRPPWESPDAAPPSPPPAPPAELVGSAQEGQRMNERLQQLLEKEGVTFGAGAVRGLADLQTGAAQIYNRVTGDETAQRQLEDVVKQRRDIMQRFDPEGSGISKADLGSAGMSAAMFAPVAASGVGAATGMGLLQGNLTPSASDEEAQFNTALGGAVGAASGLVDPARRMTSNAVRRFLQAKAPRNYAQDVGAAMGHKPAFAKEGYDRLSQALRESTQKAKTVYQTALDKAEMNPDLSRVKLSASREARRQGDMSTEVAKSMNPKIRAMAEAMGLAQGQGDDALRASLKDQPYRVASSTSFRDVRETLRKIKDQIRRYEKAQNTSAIGPLQQMQELLEKDLDTWAKRSPLNNAARVAGRKADDFYAQEVLPRRKMAIEVLRPKADTSSMEQQVDKVLFGGGTIKGGQAGTRVEEMLKQTPEARGPARQIQGKFLRIPRGDVGSAQQYLGGTTLESLATQKELKYLSDLSDELLESGGLQVKIPYVDSATAKVKATLAPLLKQFGVKTLEPYGGFKQVDKNTRLSRALRALLSGGQTSTINAAQQPSKDSEIPWE